MTAWFVSYAWGDDKSPAGLTREQRVDQACEAACARGLVIRRDKDVLRAGDSIERFMREIGAGDRVFVFLSDKYLRSPFCMFELCEVWRHSRKDAEVLRSRLRLWTLDDADVWTPEGRAGYARHWRERYENLKPHVPDLGGRDLLAWQHMRTFHNEVGDILATLADTVQPRDFDEFLHRGFSEEGLPDEGAPPAPPPPVVAASNIPVQVPHLFMGRDDALAAIRAALRRDRGRVAITALHGLRGVGKTTLAAAYCERHRGDYRATWWVRAQTEPTMRADLVALGVRLGWVGPEDKEEPALAAVMERLRHEGEGVLLVYDNALDVRSLTPYLPWGGHAHVLVTSNAHAWRGVAEPVAIRLWPKAVGAEYLIARTGRAAEREAAEALSEALGGLPLAHEQAAAYCERLEISLAEYASRLAAEPVQMLDKARYAPTEYHDGLTVAKTFALAIEEAARQHPAAEPLIEYLALLAPEPIPLFLLREGRKALGEPLAALLDGDGLDEALAALRAFALLDRESIADERELAVETDTVRLHRLVREIAAARLPLGEAREAAQRALVMAMAAVYPDQVFNDPRTWPRARRLDALVLALVGDESGVPGSAEEQTAWLLDRLASYRQAALASYAQARPLFERALAIRERALGPDYPGTASSLNNLALLLRHQGDLDAARPLFERALAINERALGPDHPSTASSLNNLAMLLWNQGDLDGAQSLLERALAIRERTLGPDHPDTAQSLNNLALLLRHQGDLDAARPMHERALAINERTLGPDHPDTALVRSNHASLLLATGELNAAQAASEAALAAHEKTLGPEHPWTKTSARVAADALVALGRTAETAALRARYGLAPGSPT